MNSDFRPVLWLRHVFSFLTPCAVIHSAVFTLHIYSSEMKNDFTNGGGRAALLVFTGGGKTKTTDGLWSGIFNLDSTSLIPSSLQECPCWTCHAK